MPWRGCRGWGACLRSLWPRGGVFRLLRALRDQAVNINPDPTQQTMGMSGDFEIAIEEGAKVVRVGQAIFGARPGGDAHYWPGLIPTPKSREQ
jgi:PLP dependent protein